MRRSGGATPVVNQGSSRSLSSPRWGHCGSTVARAVKALNSAGRVAGVVPRGQPQHDPRAVHQRQHRQERSRATPSTMAVMNRVCSALHPVEEAEADPVEQQLEGVAAGGRHGLGAASCRPGRRRSPACSRGRAAHRSAPAGPRPCGCGRRRCRAAGPPGPAGCGVLQARQGRVDDRAAASGVRMVPVVGVDAQADGQVALGSGRPAAARPRAASTARRRRSRAAGTGASSGR